MPNADLVSDVLRLKENILRYLKKRFTVCVTLKRGEWKLNSGTLELVFDSNFDISFIKGELSSIQDAVKVITGKGMKINIRQKINKDQKIVSREINDKRIEIVKAAFRGEIISKENE